MAGKPATRLHVEVALGDGLTVELAPDQAHRLRTVLRLGPGDRVALFNGRDGEWLCRIDRLARGTGIVAIEGLLRPQQPVSDLWLAFAPVKRAPLDLLVEKATELGVSAFLPVITRRTQVDRFNLDRLRAHAREAAEQSERLTLPRIAEPQPLDRLIAGWPAERRLVLCDETGAAPPIAAALAGLAHGPLAVMVGPEGGFAESELDGLRKLAFVSPVGLGPLVLRSDTAALVGLAVVQALIGDWGAPRRRLAGAAADAPT